VYCSGWWLSVITLLAYLWATGSLGETSFLLFGVEAFAVAGVQMIINRTDDTLGGE
jgi:hypothetical protein